MQKVKIAVVGAGGMANNVHYPSLHSIKDVEIVGISDLSTSRMEETAKKYGVERTFTDYREMLEKTSPDGVYVIMPPYHLYDITFHCLSQGLHVFIEKPPGVTREQTRQLANTAAKKGCLTMVGFQRRFAPAIVEAKKKIEERGQVIHCQANFFKHHINQPPYYNGAIDILTCDAIHSVDILRYIAGEPAKIVSSVKNLFAEYDNCFHAMVEFENGATGFLAANWVTGKRIYNIEMHGKGICAFVNPEDTAVIYKDNKEQGEVMKAEELAGSKEFFRLAGFYDENKHFIECIKTKKQPQTNFADALKTMEFVDNIYHSII